MVSAFTHLKTFIEFTLFLARIVLELPWLPFGFTQRLIEKLESKRTLPKSTFPEFGLPSSKAFPKRPGTQTLLVPVESRLIRLPL